VRKASTGSFHALAEQRVQPGSLVIVVVGDASKVQADLEKIAPVTPAGP
jgi:hypothetical protein